MLEMSKVIPWLVLNYDLEAVDGQKPWKTRNY